MSLQKLRPTVKRDLSVFSVLAWEQGYTTYLKRDMSWWYDVFLHFDGEKVNFYHRLKDFEYFKDVVTQKLIADLPLFSRLNGAFKENVADLKKELASASVGVLPRISVLIGEIMSLYIFIVSDDFVAARPEAWESRNLSEGILYEADKKAESLSENLLASCGFPKKLSHFSTVMESARLAADQKTDTEAIARRAGGYIVYRHEIITGQTFREFCDSHDLECPTIETPNSITELVGTPVYAGKVRGKVKIVRNLRDAGIFDKGDVLVTIMTNVNYLSAMKRAKALVTDEGGVTSHAAIVAREFKIPTVTATKVATQVLKDGDLIEVDGEKGVVTVLKKAEG